MRSTFGGLETAKRALVAQQAAMDLAAHNLANVATPGYSRQSVRLTPVSGAEVVTGAAGRPADNIGGGVDVSGVVRIRDAFLDRQARDAAATGSSWKSRRDTLSRIETIFSEPSDNGLATQLQEYWNAWGEVAAHPTLASARFALRGKADTMAATFRRISSGLAENRASLDSNFRALASEVNDIASRMSDFNRKIMTSTVANMPAGDLEDARDLLADRLAAITGARVATAADGSMRIFIGGVEVVGPYTFQKISVTDDPANGNMAKATWANNGADVAGLGGEMAAILTLRDTDLPALGAQIDTLTASVVTATNARHSAGFGLDGLTGRDFFNAAGTTAATIDLSAAVKADPSVIAASTAGEPGDGANASAIAALGSQAVVSGAKPGDYYSGVLSELGIAVSEATNEADTFDALGRQIENHRATVSGVSPDEEMIDLMRYQRAYQAAARVLTTLDETLDTLINRMGAVGR